MNAKQLSLLGIRIVSIYLIAQGISNIPNMHLIVSAYAPDDNYGIVVLGSILTAILSPLIIGMVLWFIAPKICKYIIDSNQTSETNIPLNVNQFQSTVLILIGVYIIATKLPFSISLTYQLFTDTIEINGIQSFKDQLLYNTISINMQSALGLLLLFSSNNISILLSKIRTFGLENK